MADRSVASTDTLETLRTTYNLTAADVGDISSITSASGVIASATDIVEAVTAINTEVNSIKAGTAVFETKLTFEGDTDDAHETVLAITDPTADRTITIPDASGTIVITSSTDTLTNKTIALGSNTISGSLSQFNSALSGDSFVSLTGTETLTNKTLTSPTLNSPTITTLTATALNLTDASIVFEGATADAHETTLTVTDPTADRTITLPNETGTLITSASAATNAFSIALAAALG